MRVALSLSILFWLWHVVAADDLLQLIVWGKGDGSVAALADLAQDKATYADQFVTAEGSSSYKLISAGSSLPVARNLRPATNTGGRKLDVGCPNSCSNSGSVKCQSLGCAYCGKCGGRRLRDGEGATIATSKGGSTPNNKRGRSRGRSLQFLKTSTEQRQIESDFAADFSQYCAGRDNCTLYARVMRVYSNGTTVRAI